MKGGDPGADAGPQSAPVSLAFPPGPGCRCSAVQTGGPLFSHSSGGPASESSVTVGLVHPEAAREPLIPAPLQGCGCSFSRVTSCTCGSSLPFPPGRRVQRIPLGPEVSVETQSPNKAAFQGLSEHCCVSFCGDAVPCPHFHSERCPFFPPSVGSVSQPAPQLLSLSPGTWPL
jgi:hypothetical protein